MKETKIKMRLFVVLALLVSFSAQAEFVSADFVRVILEEIKFSRAHDVVDTMGRSMRLFAAKTENVLAPALARENYAVIPSRPEFTGKKMVIRVLPARAKIISMFEGKPHPGISDGELELGFFVIANGKSKAKIEELIMHNGEKSVLDQGLVGLQESVGVSLLQLDGGQIEKALIEEVSKTPGVKFAWNDLTVAAPKIVKVNEEVYGIVRTIRINAENLTPQQVQFMIESLAALL